MKAFEVAIQVARAAVALAIWGMRRGRRGGHGASGVFARLPRPVPALSGANAKPWPPRG